MAGKREKYPFVISDESTLNGYGFRVITAGIQLTQYERNPIVIWFHKRPGYDDWERLPIGLASNFRIEGSQLLADIEFDPEDEFAQKIEKKVEGGFLRMVSPGLEPLLTSDKEEDLLPGQGWETLMESKLIEISIVDIGANDNALRLYKNSKLVTLSANGENTAVPKIELNKPHSNSKNTNMEFIKRVAVLLALQPDASEESIMQTLQGKLELANKTETIQLAHDQLATQVKQINDNAIIALVDANVDKRFTADKRESMIQLGKDSGIETLKSVINMMPEAKKPGDVVTLSANGGQEDKIEKFEDLLTLGREKLVQFRTEQPEEYVKLYKAYYGFVPKLEDK